jgi:hypothetical protein
MIVKIIYWLLLGLLPVGILVREYIFRDESTVGYRRVFRSLIVTAIATIVLSIVVGIFDSIEATKSQEKVDRLLNENTNLTSQLEQTRGDLNGMATKLIKSQDALISKSEEISILNKSLAKKSEETLELNRSVEQILHPPKATEVFEVNVIIDRVTSKIYAWNSIPYFYEEAVPASLDPEKAAMDATIHAIISFIGWRESDWQMEKLSAPSGDVWQRKSTEKDSTIITKKMIGKLLNDTGNVFHNNFLLPMDLRLPPNSEFKITIEPSGKVDLLSVISFLVVQNAK